jgi:5-methylcytosine-specific restriction endonuclease McrA
MKNRALPSVHGNSSEYQEARALAFRARLKDFVLWIESGGGVVVDTKSEFEVLRYLAWDATQRGKAKRPATHIVWRKNDGRVTFSGCSSMHWSLFVARRPFPDQSRMKLMKETERKRLREPGSKRPSWARRTRDLLRERDGDECWYCGQPCLEDETNPDMKPTVEHLLARHLGGTDNLDNLVLAHALCNRQVGHRTVEEKKAVRRYIRAGLYSTVAHWCDENPDTEINPPARSRPVQPVAGKQT